MPIKKSDIEYLTRSVSIVKPGLRPVASQVLTYFKERKILHFKTAESLINDLRNGHKKSAEKVERKLATYQDKISATGTLKRQLEASHIQRTGKAAKKIMNSIRMTNFDHKLVLKVIKHETAFKNNAQDITIVPSYVGSLAATNIKLVLAKAFMLARKLVTNMKNYKFHSKIQMKSTKDFQLYKTSTNYNKDDMHKWLDEFTKVIFELFQSDDRVFMKDITMSFHFVNIPSGSGWAVSRNLNEHHKKRSVITIVNQDDNCFWYALTCLIHVNHVKKQQIIDGRKIRVELAKKLCDDCHMPWNAAVSLDSIRAIEKYLRCNIYVLDSDKIPFQGMTTSLLDSDAVMYKSGHDSTLPQFFLLYSDNHFDAIKNISAFLCVRYFCHECMSTFTHKSKFESHKCTACETAREKTLNPLKSSFYKDAAHYMKPDFTGLKGSEAEIDYLVEQTPAVTDEANLRLAISNTVNSARYIIWDAETDTSTGVHLPNLIVVEVLEVDGDNDYSKSLKSRKNIQEL